MNVIENLKQLDPWTVFWSIIVLLAVVSYVFDLWEKTFGKLGLETKGMRKKREDREKLEANIILAKTTAENLDKLEKRHAKDEAEFKANLNNYMAESRADRKALHDELTSSVQSIADGEKVRDKQIEALMGGTKELLGSTIDKLYSKYIALDGIPENEVDEFDAIYDAYAKLKGNHGRETKYKYVKHHLRVIPVETKLIIETE